MMKHKGYTGILQIDEDSGVLCGDVIGLQDVITFQGDTVAEARQAFRDSVDDYLEFCASRGEAPEKPFSGRFLVRIPSTLHRSLVEEAAARGVSLNALVERTLAAEFASDESEVSLSETKAASKPKAPAKARVKPKAKAKAPAKTPATPAAAALD